jgi:hypothetical protein
MKRQDVVDVLTMILLGPFCIWLGWWGILPAFGIGFIINLWCDVVSTAPGCSGPCDGGRAPCKCETGRRKGGA